MNFNTDKNTVTKQHLAVHHALPKYLLYYISWEEKVFFAVNDDSISQCHKMM